MDTTLRYYGRLRTAKHCGTLHGTLHGRDVYYLDVECFKTLPGEGPTWVGISSDGRAIVLVSSGTTDQATPIFLGASHSDTDLDAVLAIEWSDSEAATRAREWVAAECTGRGQELMQLAAAMRGGLFITAEEARETREINKDEGLPDGPQDPRGVGRPVWIYMPQYTMEIIEQRGIQFGRESYGPAIGAWTSRERVASDLDIVNWLLGWLPAEVRANLAEVKINRTEQR